MSSKTTQRSPAFPQVLTSYKLLEIERWTFGQIAGVEPTNNAAERAIRPGVLWRKESVGTQTEVGSRFVESLLTVVAMLKQQQRNVFAYLTAACEAALRGEAAPALLPARHQQMQAAA
jgi:transposase